MKKNRVLIVEDEQIIAFDLRMTLKLEGFDVLALASNADDAVEIALREKPDIILMDIQLDGEKTGIDAAEEILSQYNVPILFQSGNHDIFQENAISELPQCSLIIKPISDKKLLKMINSIIENHKVID